MCVCRCVCMCMRVGVCVCVCVCVCVIHKSHGSDFHSNNTSTDFLDGKVLLENIIHNVSLCP